MNQRLCTSGCAAALAVLLLAFATARAEDKKDDSGKPPKGATVLFDGKDLSGWLSGSKPAEWKVTDGYVEVAPGKGDIKTKDTFGPDFKLHVEFWLPLMADKKDQARANSGVYLQGRYEIQVLDSYMNDTYANGSVGALYGIIAPDADAQKKAVKPPEQWNTYDITFHAPRVDDKGKVTEKGRVTVVLNGVTLIDDGKCSGPCDRRGTWTHASYRHPLARSVCKTTARRRKCASAISGCSR